jgi:hypothetical protein
MWAVGPTHLIALLLVVAALASVSGYLGSALARRKKRRARTYFTVGFVCGLTTGAILRGRSRGLSALAAFARRVDVGPLSAGNRRGSDRFAVRALRSVLR